MAVSPIYVDRSTAGDHEEQSGSCRIWSDWKCNRLLPLVALALSGLEEALWWPLSQLPRHSFGGISGNELEGLDLVA